MMGDMQDPAKKTKKFDQSLKASRPTGMNREVYALLYADSINRYGINNIVHWITFLTYTGCVS